MGFEKVIPPPFEHQIKTVVFARKFDRIYDASDPGTGKTRSWIDIIVEKQAAGARKALVLAPKSILQPSWGNDLHTFAPGKRYSIARAKNREAAFKVDADIYITNHDAVKWLAEHPEYLEQFDILVVDEITAYKHRTSQRSKALKAIKKFFKIRSGLSGSVNPNTLTDIWHQYLILDDGEHLGDNFWKFRQTVCEPRQIGPGAGMVEWVDRPGALEAVADIVSDMTIRHKFEDCIDIPPNFVRNLDFDLSPSHLAAYVELKKRAILELETGTISAIHAGALATKLLQLASGAVYDQDHVGQLIATERYELVMQLAEEREQCLISFVWTHQRDEMIKLAKAMGMSYVLIDGSVVDDARDAAVATFQAGNAKLCFAHPMSASHGLTLTAATTTIWPSPIYDAERFQQFNKRVPRAGQKQKTETIRITAAGTMEAEVYDKLDGKLDRMATLLSMLQLTPSKAA